MNKPQYLAELGQLLVFMTRADREQTLARYEALFDEAGPDGLEALLNKLGTPTHSAIRLSRIYEPMLFTDQFLDDLEDEYALGPDLEEEEPESEEDEDEPEEPDMVEGIEDLDIPPMVMNDLSGFEPIPAPEPAPEPEPEEEEDEDEAPEDEAEEEATEEESEEEPPAAPAPAPAPQAYSDLEDPLSNLPASIRPQEAGPDGYQGGPVVVIQRSIPLWLGIPLFILSLVLLAVPIACVCLLLLPLLLLPGLVLLLGTWLAAVGGLWCISYIADAVMLFGLAFLIFALALIALWCGLRLDVAIVSLYIRACRALTHLTLGKKVTQDA